ncbi:MAG: hypothetical protein E6K79_11310 [Candidatus Eisenbacteria bacterium]|uniref:HMA domain-containing protein n=1 Tax=Eiseniibacteriota bacterium TaxID=2212470 RepID=A0A538TGW3_UNCEI|nr:MAG: hypothetical protein E6K79_11310 [Candidatus Eisenbacteria bacterium]
MKMVVAALILIASSPAMAAPSSAGRPTVAAAPDKADPPFARVYLAVRGCMSCSHCRTAIRQMVRSNAGGGEARLGEDQVEVRYATPRAVPLRDVIRSLAESRLHDLSLVDVLFEARGTIGLAEDGTATFALAETGQSFPLVIDRAIARPAGGMPVRLTAVVDGWRKKGTLSLSAREIRPAG